MNKKSTLVLFTILHICILGVCILTIYNSRHSGVTVAHVSSETKTAVTPTEPETAAEPEASTETAPEPETETETEIKTETESKSETETAPETVPPVTPSSDTTALYSFHFIGTHKNLNIRNAPSTKAKIIGKIPIGGSGKVLELTNEHWALIEYNGIVGYSSRHWIELQKIAE